jgi:outer membrane protein OmpA-like peptidoglycan-associated protein
MTPRPRTAVNLGLAGCLVLGLLDLGLLNLWAAPRAFQAEGGVSTSETPETPHVAQGPRRADAGPAHVSSREHARADAGQQLAVAPKQGPSQATAPAPDAAIRPPDAAVAVKPVKPSEPVKPSQPVAPPLPKAIVVYFDTNSKVLRPRDVTRLQQLASQLGQAKVMIEGHTDQRGSEAKNSQLAVDRAEIIRDRLKSLGVTSDRITVRGFGSSKPADLSDTPAGWQKNRRVEIRIY